MVTRNFYFKTYTLLKNQTGDVNKTCQLSILELLTFYIATEDETKNLALKTIRLGIAQIL